MNDSTATPIRIVSSSPKAVVDLQIPEDDSLDDLDLNKNDETLPETNLEHNNDGKLSSPWSTCPTSAKSLRTRNPIRAIVDPIVKNIQSGQERGDGKDHISLAVSTCRCLAS